MQRSARPQTLPKYEFLQERDSPDSPAGVRAGFVNRINLECVNPLWQMFFLSLALLVFAIETVIANVLAQRRSQSAEVHIATGRLNKRRKSQPFH